ncbi:MULTISPECIES: hypothetical protein [Acinetobacter]|uniref:hypothetical protein n=1 Tax=Acinetobacter TaxID=469 RepID=UPI001D0F3F3A|nr:MULTISPECIES: hypothetical protein [Acinetobacter]
MMKNNSNIGVVKGNNNNFKQTIHQGGCPGHSSEDSTLNGIALLGGVGVLVLSLMMFYLLYFEQILFFLKLFIVLTVVLFVFKIIYPFINKQQDFQEITDSILGLFFAGLLAVMVNMTEKAMPQQILIIVEELGLESDSDWKMAWQLWTQFKPLGHKIILCNMGASLSLILGLCCNLLYSFNLFKPFTPVLVVATSLLACCLLAIPS